MDGKRLMKLMFTARGQQVAFAKLIGVDRQDLPKKFNRKRIDIEMLKTYAKWKGIDEKAFISMALADDEPDTGYKLPAAQGMELKEPTDTYGLNLKERLSALQAENIKLHEKIAEQGKFILQLLKK